MDQETNPASQPEHALQITRGRLYDLNWSNIVTFVRPSLRDFAIFSDAIDDSAQFTWRPPVPSSPEQSIWQSTVASYSRFDHRTMVNFDFTSRENVVAQPLTCPHCEKKTVACSLCGGKGQVTSEEFNDWLKHRQISEEEIRPENGEVTNDRNSTIL